MPPDLLHADLNLGGILFLLFILWPIIKSVFDAKSEAAKKAAPKPRPRRAEPPDDPAFEETLEGPMDGATEVAGPGTSWKDLLAGRHDLPAGTEVVPELLSDEFHDHEGTLSPTTILGEVASEEEFERHGGDRGDRLVETEALQSIAEFSAGEDELSGDFGEAFPVFGKPIENERAAYARRARTVRFRPRRGDSWRSAVVVSEILGPPVVLRTGGAHPGPPASAR